MIALAILVPLLIGVAAIALADRRSAKYIALGASIATLAMVPFSTGSASIQWLSVGSYAIDIVVSTAALNLMLVSLVAFMAPFVLFYAFGYMALPSEQKRFYAEMIVFELSMLLFAMSGSFVTLFIGWEFLSLTSYLLVGFWYERERAVRAARKVISIVMLGDLALLASIVLFFVAYGTLNFAGIVSARPSSMSLAYAAVSLLVIAVFTKSAQFPFHEWLADAMEGPVPVSAMLHSTTMVKAGVFVAMVLLPLLIAFHFGIVLLVFGLVTAVLATFDAMRERHIKKVLAYSTVQELSLMFVALGANALLAAVYFFIAQSFYKALLFFSAGSSMTATGKDSINDISGMSSNRLLFISTAFGVLALAGFVPFDGFFASAGLGYAFSSNLLVYALLLAISMLTSFFIFRWLALCSKPATEEREKIIYKALPNSMLIPGAVLAALAAAAGILFLFVPQLFAKVPYALTGKPLAIDWPGAIAEMLAASVGALLAWRIYKYAPGKSKTAYAHSHAANMLQSTKAFNLAYALLAYAFYAFASGVYYFEEYLRILFDDIAVAVGIAASATRRIASGQLSAYVAAFVIGFVLLLLVLVI
ncbi:MAG: NADH-quinone oxidoreductase subunit L [Candidatus Micrarchaeia archaeon]